MDKDNSKIIALTGAGLLALGTFLPLVRVPKMGTINFISDGRGYGVIVLVLAVVAILLALLDRTKHAIWPGIVSAVIISLAFGGLQARLSEVRQQAREELSDNPFAGLAEAAAGSIQLEYGWVFLAIGAVMVIAGGGLAWRKRNQPPAS